MISSMKIFEEVIGKSRGRKWLVIMIFVKDFWEVSFLLGFYNCLFVCVEFLMVKRELIFFFVVS